MRARFGTYFSFLVALQLFVLIGCGGGSDVSVSPPPPPPPSQPSFTLNVSPSTVSIVAAGESRATISIQPLNNFSGQVTLGVQNLPASIAAVFTLPAIVPSQSSEIVLRAASDAASQTIVFSVVGTSAPLNSSTSVSLQITAGSALGGSRSTFVRVDGPLFDVAFDPVHNLLFGANPQQNQVEVFSSTQYKRVATLPISQAISLAVTPDGSRLYVGTTGDLVYTVDIAALEVIARMALPRTGFFPYTTARKMIVAANGSVLIIAGVAGLTNEALLQWNPATGSVINRSADASPFRNVSRTADGSKVLLLDFGSGEVYDSATDSFKGHPNLIGPWGQISPDGSHFVLLNSKGVQILDSSFQVLATFTATFAGKPIFSGDGRYVYFPGDITILANQGKLTAVDTQTLSSVGEIPDLYISGQSPPFSDRNPHGITLWAGDASGMLFGPCPRGFCFIDASHPTALTASPPIISPAFNPGPVSPSSGPLNTPTSTTISGANFRSGSSVFFGSFPGQNFILGLDGKLHADSPPSSTSGPVNVRAVSSDGWWAMAPEAFTYGPHVLYMTPAGGPTSGGVRLDIMGYGFGYTKDKIQVTVGGKSAVVLDPWLYSGSAEFYLPLHHLYVDVPSGTAGAADIVITTPAGSTTIPGGFHYLARVKNFPVSGQLRQVLYDRFRRRVYISNTTSNQIEVFSVAGEQFLAPLSTGNSPNSMTMMPDGSWLLVTNSGDKTLSIINPDDPTQTRSIIVPDPADPYDPRPAELAATSTGKVFVATYWPTVSGCDKLREVNLNTMTVQDRVEPTFICYTNGTYLRSSYDGSRVFVAVGANSGGDVGVWDAATDLFTIRQLQRYLYEVAAAGDGNRFMADFNILDSQANKEGSASLVDLIAQFTGVGVRGNKLHASGGLFYLPLADGLHIYDLPHGSLIREYAGLSISSSAVDAMTIDDAGRTIFAISTTGLQLVELDSVPMSIGSLLPSQGSSAGGDSVTLRGSGFKSGATVSFGGSVVSATFVDENTLRVDTPAHAAGGVRVTVTNPGGEQCRLDAAFLFK